jgi:hypothetical protein
MATTTNYGWTTPDDTALVKDGAAAIRTLGSSVDTTTKALNPETTLGDIAYRSSSANVKTRLGIGTTGQILTVSGGVPAWTTISSSSGATLINRTAFSASSGVTIDSLFSTTYENYLVAIQAYHSSGNVQLRLQGRAGGSTDAGNIYNYGFTGRTAGSATTVGFQSSSNTQLVLGQMSSIGSGNVANLQIYRASSSDRLYVTGSLITAYDSEFLSGGGFFANASAWDGLYLSPASGTITGQITIYGLAKS